MPHATAHKPIDETPGNKAPKLTFFLLQQIRVHNIIDNERELILRGSTLEIKVSTYHIANFKENDVTRDQLD